MSDRMALIFGGVIVAAIAGDLLLNDGAAMLFLLVKFADMIEWLAFWR
ncbi:hypothetical protein [Pseudotabrizicola algicola]|nr:hypothetical protein [Pseudotabrizicola algicola]